MDTIRHSFSKEERLCGKSSIAALMDKGRWGSMKHLRYCVLKKDSSEGEPNRLLVSVPKRNFKRAVKRNLLKRRMREAYRLQKEILPPTGTDLMLVYLDKEIVSFDVISSEVKEILDRCASL